MGLKRMHYMALWGQTGSWTFEDIPVNMMRYDMALESNLVFAALGAQLASMKNNKAHAVCSLPNFSLFTLCVDVIL